MISDKDLFNEQIFEYAQTIFGTFFAEILYVLPGAVISSIIAFFLAIVVLVFLSKKQVFRRDNMMWSLIAKLHYPMWIVIFVVIGFVNGVVSAVGSRAELALEETGKPIVEASIPILYKYLLSDLPVSLPNEKTTIRSATDQIMKDLAYAPKTDSQVEYLRAQSINWITSNVGEWIITYAVNGLVTQATQGAGRALDFSEDDLEFSQASLIDMNISKTESLISQVVYEGIKGQLKSAISGIKNNMYFMFFLVILLLLLEPAIYYLWRNKFSNTKRIHEV